MPPAVNEFHALPQSSPAMIHERRAALSPAQSVTVNSSMTAAPSVSKRVAVYDIAKKVGVSHTTVACALGNRKEIFPKRREEILRVAAEMGYTPDPHLSALDYRRKFVPPKFHGVIVWVNHGRQPD